MASWRRNAADEFGGQFDSAVIFEQEAQPFAEINGDARDNRPDKVNLGEADVLANKAGR
ncbi:MAG: hypothetical protein ACKVJU_02950 [Verrucomicrobiales bacterium]